MKEGFSFAKIGGFLGAFGLIAAFRVSNDIGIIGAAILGGLGALFGSIIGSGIDTMFLKKNKNPESVDSNEITSNEAEKEISATSEKSLSKQEINETVTKKIEPYYYGFGGWLYLFSAGIAFQFFRLLKSSYDKYLLMQSDDYHLFTDRTSELYNSLWEPLIIFECIAEVFLCVIILLIAFYCIKLNKKFKTFSITFIAASVVFQFIDLIFMLNIQNWYDFEMYTESELYTGISQSTIYAIIWIPYFLISKRVKNTFV